MKRKKRKRESCGSHIEVTCPSRIRKHMLRHLQNAAHCRGKSQRTKIASKLLQSLKEDNTPAQDDKSTVHAKSIPTQLCIPPQFMRHWNLLFFRGIETLWL
jgi:hypothetical protein